MRTALAFGVLWLASSFINAHEEVRPTALTQRAAFHPGPATVDLSADGRFVAFASAVSLSPADRNTAVDIYVLDRSTRRVTLESVPIENVSNDWTVHPRLSGDGRYLVFSGWAYDAAQVDMASAFPQVILRDRHTGETTLISRNSVGTPANGPSGHADISDDGRTIVFESAATDVGGLEDRNGRPDVYAFDVDSQTITKVSVDVSGRSSAVASSFAPSVSGDGRYVVFVSSAPLDGGFGRQLVQPPAERCRHVYLRHLATGVTRQVSTTRGSKNANGMSFHPTVSSDGARVAFVSLATNLVQRDRNGVADVYLYDARTDRTTLVSRSARHGSATGSSGHPALSADGRFVAFVSNASDLMCAGRCPGSLLDLNLVSDVYLFDTLTEAIVRVSGAHGAAPWWEASAGPSLDAAGRVIAFSSRHPMNESDTGHDFDLFVTERPPAASGLLNEARFQK